LKENSSFMSATVAAHRTAQQTLAWGAVTLPTRFCLAPLAGYTNLAFRLAVRELGGLGLATTDLVNARALLRENPRALELVATCPADRPMAVQIYGAEPDELRAAARWLEAYGASSVDINMGCPVHKVVRGGGGSALMCDPEKSVALVRRVVEGVQIPVTVKMRLGWDESSLSAPFFAREFEQVGVAGLTIHGRTRAQGFGGNVNHAGIRAVVEAVEHIPVIGNGDVRTVPEAKRMLEETGCAGIAIGRGALLNPFVFVQLRRWELTGDPGLSPTYDERLDFMHRHFHLQIEERGERIGCITFRKISNWYSRVLKPSPEQHRSLMLIDCVNDFDRIVDELRDRGPPPFYQRSDWEVPMPKGPHERW
jgi:nifR3 family TIM-barrel protein